jgi:hypothetical protein
MATITRSAFAILSLAVSAGAFGQAPPTVELTYVGSHGFLVAGGGKKMLLDAAMPSGLSPWGYVLPPEETRRKIESAEPPYDGIDLITISHAHEDHFSPATVYGAMLNNPGAWLVASPEAYLALIAAKPEIADFKDRIWVPSSSLNETEERSINGIPFGVTVMSHGTGTSMKLMTLFFDLAGMRFLHLNEWNRLAAADYDAIGFNRRPADVAILGYGYVNNGSLIDILETKLKPGFTVVCHVDGASPAAFASIRASMDKLSASRPMAMPTRPGDKVIVSRGTDGHVMGSLSPAP